MNNDELQRLLKSARPPEWSADYWQDFPRRVVSDLRAEAMREEAGQWIWRPSLAWGFAMAVLLGMIGYGIEHRQGEQARTAANGILQNETVIREILSMFPNRVQAIVHDDRGFSLILSEQPDIPASHPVWVKVCRGEECQSLVTFSGQEVQIAGLGMTVLSDAEGGVILMGDRFAWASADPGLAPADLRIRAEVLNLASLN